MKVQQITEEERTLREENVRLQRRLLREKERREQLSRQMSESESSLEMDEERQFNERARYAGSPVSYSPSPTRRLGRDICRERCVYFSAGHSHPLLLC